MTMLTHAYPLKLMRKIKLAVSRLTAHLTYGLMSALVICNQSMVLHDTKCAYKKQVSFKQHKTQTQTFL